MNRLLFRFRTIVVVLAVLIGAGAGTRVMYRLEGRELKSRTEQFVLATQRLFIDVEQSAFRSPDAPANSVLAQRSLAYATLAVRRDALRRVAREVGPLPGLSASAFSTSGTDPQTGAISSLLGASAAAGLAVVASRTDPVIVVGARAPLADLAQRLVVAGTEQLEEVVAAPTLGISADDDVVMRRIGGPTLQAGSSGPKASSAWTTGAGAFAAVLVVGLLLRGLLRRLVLRRAGTRIRAA